VLAATLLALGAAVLHAVWNLLVKTSADRLLALWGLYVAGGVLLLPLLVIDVPGFRVLPLILASCLIHTVYAVFLSRAYQTGDFSFAYPLARGGGALVAALGGVLILGDHLPPAAWLAIAVVVAGLARLAGGRGPSSAALAWAGLTAATIGTYTTVDAAGARESSALGYGVTLLLGAGVVLTVVLALAGRAEGMVATATGGWRRCLVGGVASGLAYCMVLAGTRLAPVGYVAALRESSVVLGAAAGWLVLHERQGVRRVTSSAVVAGGLVLLVVAGR
jgi:drug/metabolite transporter (DMT)-like permease